jgi:hypothetical protein
MTFKRRNLTAVAAAVLALGFPTGARAAANTESYSVAANVNDAAISTARGANLIWLPARPVGKLLVFLPSGGTNNLPTEFKWVGAEGARLGYHTIVLAYRNEVGIAAAPPLGCGNAAEPPVSPANCAIDVRRELLDGRGESSVVDVDRPNSIENRLTKLLQHLVANHADEGWAPYLDVSGDEPAPKWSETVIAGHSLGSGQAALIGMLHPVARVALFSGWSDAKHGWVHIDATPSDRYFALTHQRDTFFARTCYAYLALELAASCPLPGFAIPPPVPDPANPFLPDPDNPLLVENRQPPFGTRQLVFDLNPAPNPPQVLLDPYHPASSRDAWVPKEDDGTPSQKLLNAWRSLLGDSDADTRLDQVDNCPQLATDNQADTDHDGRGDACDPTPQGTTPPTIIVPGHITVDATGPGGATVPYTVTATDDLPPAPSPVCTPAAGSLFAIGDTSVACTATDAGDNTANASFLVTVLGAKEQLANLIRKVIDATSLPAATKTQLTASLQSLAAGFDPSKPLQRAVACLTLRAFTTLLPFVASPAQRSEWTADANRIRAVLAC